MRSAASDLTQTGVMLGSPKYMSPEQVIGKRADHRSDIFSLGVILYEMLTGSTPFNGDNVTALMYQIVNFAPPAPSALNGAVPVLADYIVAKMLAKTLEERYQSAAELSRDLRECERQLSGAAGSAVPGPAAGLASGPQPELLDTNVKTVVLAQTINRTRVADSEPSEAAAPPARGLAHSFDSLEATQRLATLTGATTPQQTAVVPAAEEAERQTATQAIESMRPARRQGWRRRDWIVVAVAGVLGAAAARALVRSRRS
jgi:serine/threonine-protein kinase